MCEPSRSLTPGRTVVYRLAFIRNCHRWLAAGYAMLDVRSLSTAEEPAITGELVRAMKEAKLKPDAPTWMIRMYVADDPPVNAPGRLGKQRRRVDIEFERSERGSTLHFHCEAKRLYRHDSAVEYLGKNGLGMFVTGEYGRDEEFGGMLAYIQTRGLAEWVARLKTTLASARSMYAVTDDGALEKADLVEEVPQIYISKHERSTIGGPIIVFHTFLLFAEN